MNKDKEMIAQFWLSEECHFYQLFVISLCSGERPISDITHWFSNVDISFESLDMYAWFVISIEVGKETGETFKERELDTLVKRKTRNNGIEKGSTLGEEVENKIEE